MAGTSRNTVVRADQMEWKRETMTSAPGMAEKATCPRRPIQHAKEIDSTNLWLMECDTPSSFDD